MTGGRRYRVIQWATGNVGARALRTVIEHPQLELVGLWVSSDVKAGQDAGTLAGLPPCGILATRSIDDLIDTPADCVLYMRQGTDLDELCRLLESGKNVVTTRGDFHHPPSMAPTVRDRIETACRAGKSSIYSTGSSPGFVTEALPLPLLSLSRRLDCLTIDEYADLSSRNSPALLFDIMGFGRAPQSFDPGQIAHVKQDFAGSLAQLAAATGVAIDEWEAMGEFGIATRDIGIAAGTVPVGTVAAQRITVSGLRSGRAALRFRANWYCGREIDRTDWALRPSGWHMLVEGDTPLDVAISFPVAPEDYAAFTPGLTAHRAVNAVAALCEAPPGIRTTADLPQVIARFQ
ncbi:dihydrodipicolinate reductase [Sphingobium sp. BYY-5]|uniref:NAD(P)H-dependent amine dehydrogenase family protein n=1 Tax=Sphingobium sp. BYY-5 TaxID=2926400 RepID=UPI001FA77CA9|nr:dihydrodipicolinate reductase [Sphingobium sp. BYY-5]MCI4592029.1 dihydrodipicolinate reductase [Sphingobium sp. BYY-5]